MKNLAIEDLPEDDYRLTKYANTGEFNRNTLHISNDMSDPNKTYLNRPELTFAIKIKNPDIYSVAMKYQG